MTLHIQGSPTWSVVTKSYLLPKYFQGLVSIPMVITLVQTFAWGLLGGLWISLWTSLPSVILLGSKPWSTASGWYSAFPSGFPQDAGTDKIPHILGPADRRLVSQLLSQLLHTHTVCYSHCEPHVGPPGLLLSRVLPWHMLPFLFRKSSLFHIPG